MKAAILAVGTELLGRERLDTNSLALAACFERFGVELVEKRVVGDDESVIARSLRAMVAVVDVVVVGGGLGPTADDRTRQGVAQAFERASSEDPSLVEALRTRYASFGRVMPEVNRRQAEVIEGAEVLANAQGSAPGQRLEVTSEGRTATVFLFPAPPRELRGMIEDHLELWLRAQIGDDTERAEERVLRVAGVPESELEETILPLYERFGRQAIGLLASPGEVRLVLRARGDRETREALLDDMVARGHALFGRSIFSEDPADSLEAAVGRLLVEAGATLVTAESCTGGLVSERLTRVPGSSAFFLGCVVTYSYELKTRLLDVPKLLMESHGAVSGRVARAMVRGALRNYGGDYAIAITGIAGPGGGLAQKPVGTVHVAVAGQASDGSMSIEHRRVRLPGDREHVRWLTSQLALDMLRRRLLRDAAQPASPVVAETSAGGDAR